MTILLLFVVITCNTFYFVMTKLLNSCTRPHPLFWCMRMRMRFWEIYFRAMVSQKINLSYSFPSLILNPINTVGHIGVLSCLVPWIRNIISLIQSLPDQRARHHGNEMYARDLIMIAAKFLSTNFCPDKDIVIIRSPLQTNNYDCGCYMVMTMKILTWLLMSGSKIDETLYEQLALYINESTVTEERNVIKKNIFEIRNKLLLGSIWLRSFFIHFLLWLVAESWIEVVVIISQSLLVSSFCYHFLYHRFAIAPCIIILLSLSYRFLLLFHHGFW